jgi:hypothetical protein
MARSAPVGAATGAVRPRCVHRPRAGADLAFHNKAVVYSMFFRAAAQALRDVAADRRYLGAEIGAIAVLHTWGQTLQHHPHLHCIVPGGGLGSDQNRWIACPLNFLLPVRVLSRRFRDVFVQLLGTAFADSELRFPRTPADLADPTAFATWVNQIGRTEWVVYAKSPSAGPEQVLDYLGRYTHRVAIANSRLVAECVGGGEKFFNQGPLRTGCIARSQGASQPHRQRNFACWKVSTIRAFNASTIFVKAEQGPALIFEHDPTALRLDRYLAQKYQALSLADRLALVRQLGDPIAFAHGKRLYHRGLAPQNILVRHSEADTPQLQITNCRSPIIANSSAGQRLQAAHGT